METAYSPRTGFPNAAAAAGGLRTKDPLRRGLVLITPAPLGIGVFHFIAGLPASPEGRER